MKIREGLNGLRVAMLTKDENTLMSAEGKATVTYSEAKHLKDVQNLDLTLRSQSTDVDADDVTETLTKCSGYDGKVQRTMFTPQEQAMLLGETVLEDGTVASSEDDEAPEFATGFRCKLKGGGYLAMWVLRCKYSLGDLSAETAGTDKLNPKSDTLSFKSMARKADGMWRIYKECADETEAEAFLSVENINKIYKKAESDASGDTESTVTAD